jgi:hypothetical protein
MPRIARTRGRALDNARIEITIAATGNAAEPGDPEHCCYICANEFCADDACCRALTYLDCCTQTMCCACLVKLSKRCRCREDCDAVVAMCPFCRDMSPLKVLDVFLGNAGPCKACQRPDVHPAASFQAPPAPSGDREDADRDGCDELEGEYAAPS